MITCLESPADTSVGNFTSSTEVIFPLRTPGLHLLPPAPTGHGTSPERTEAPVRSLDHELAFSIVTYCVIPLREVYDAWTRCNHLPGFMRAAPYNDETGPRWKLQLRHGEVPWQAVTTERVVCKRISWWGAAGDSFANRGSVTFLPVGDRTTRISVAVEFYQRDPFAVTPVTIRSCRNRIDRALDLFQMHVVPGSLLGPLGGSL